MPQADRTPPLAVLAVLTGALATGWLVLKESRTRRTAHGALLARKMAATRNDFRLLLRPFDRNLATLAACGRSDEPAFQRNDEQEDFYIRPGPSSRKLPPSRIEGWKRERRT